MERSSLQDGQASQVLGLRDLEEKETKMQCEDESHQALEELHSHPRQIHSLEGELLAKHC